jgi:hypothetical protein
LAQRVSLSPSGFPRKIYAPHIFADAVDIAPKFYDKFFPAGFRNEGKPGMVRFIFGTLRMIGICAHGEIGKVPIFIIPLRYVANNVLLNAAAPPGAQTR